MSSTKQVKVDNWGIFFLQRLKHFFNRTDYCDLTLQFQENAQLKVHRLVLNACTEYFEVLERTCEMYEDCLIMPDDLQADVVVPIINFMYTGQLEYKQHLFERLYQTAQVMNMTVLTKLLDAQKESNDEPITTMKPSNPPRNLNQTLDKIPNTMSKKVYIPSRKTAKHILENTLEQKRRFETTMVTTPILRNPSQLIQIDVKKEFPDNPPKPTRYELPAELDNELLYENSFADISYETAPVLRSSQQISQEVNENNLFGDTPSPNPYGTRKRSAPEFISNPKKSKFNMDSHFNNILKDSQPNEEEHKPDVFEHIIEKKGGKFTIETKTNCGDSAQIPEVDHSKIINEVLKRYPHLVKSNKDLKLKIVTAVPSKGNVIQAPKPSLDSLAAVTPSTSEDNDYIQLTDVTDTKAAARLVSLGADNVHGPWICLICATPGKALNFPSYYRYRRHLLEVHKEKPPHNLCEHCGLKSNKRNHMVHHLYVQHNILPPPSYRFPHCDKCSYIALTDNLLSKHKNTHKAQLKAFRCNVCLNLFRTSRELLLHIQKTGHKISPDRRAQYKCVYCNKVFLRETNLYSHLKLTHKRAAKRDGVIDNSDEEDEDDYGRSDVRMKNEIMTDEEYDDEDMQMEENVIGNMNIIGNRQIKRNVPVQKKNEILYKQLVKGKTQPISQKKSSLVHDDSSADSSEDNRNRVVILSQSTFMLNDQLKNENRNTIINAEYLKVENTSQGYSNIKNKKPTTNQPIEIIVSNDQDYSEIMQSGTSIIFEDPEHSQITEQSIDLDNSENNMMVIEQDYPIISDEVPAISSDSNIVVVYSQPMNNEIEVASSSMNQSYIESPQVFEENVVNEETVSTWHPESEVQQGNVVQTTVQVEDISAHLSDTVTLTKLTSPENNEESLDKTLPEVELEAPKEADTTDSGAKDKHKTPKEKETKKVVVNINDPKIRNLASEWTDDEDSASQETETPQSADDAKEGNETSTQEINQEGTDGSADLEESIENIQQEIHKHAESDENAEQDDSNANVVVHSAKQLNGTQSKVEVSTLLNDWDESEGPEDESIGEEQVKDKEPVADVQTNDEVVEDVVDTESTTETVAS